MFCCNKLNFLYVFIYLFYYLLDFITRFRSVEENKSSGKFSLSLTEI